MNEKTCPTCHAPVPAHAPGGFCPACLLRDAGELPVAGEGSPPLEEIAAAFPQFEVLRLIGQGGMGYVYQVRQPDLDRIAALKILAPDLGRDPAFAERFARESRALGRLNHPNIVTIYEHGESGGFFYLLMEYVDGVNLRQAMRAGRFTPEQALAIVPGICDALQAAHAQGVWHRDIKPENILLDERGGVRIADFGIARMAGERDWNFTLTRTGGALGSAAYMAPEQHENPRGVDHRADIYSLGVVIYEMLTGELPLGRFPAPSQRAAVDARIDEIVFRTLAKERELRHQSAAEVKTEVQGAANKAHLGIPSSTVPADRFRITTVVLLLASMAGYTVWGVRNGVNMMTYLVVMAVLSSLMLAIFAWRTRTGRIATILCAMVLLAVPVWVSVVQPVLIRTAILPAPRHATPPGFPTRSSAALDEAPETRTHVDWEITIPAGQQGPAATLAVKGRLDSGCVRGIRHSAVTITVGDAGWMPVCMMIAEGSPDELDRVADGKSLSGHATIEGKRFDYSIRQSDRLTINGVGMDLNQGRVFVRRPDGSFRQLAVFPQQFIRENEIEAFVATLPVEKIYQTLSNVQSGVTDEEAGHEISGNTYSSLLKQGDTHRANGDFPAALASYRAALADIATRRIKSFVARIYEGHCQARIAGVLQDQGDVKGAVRACLMAADALDQALAERPDDDRCRDELVRVNILAGDVLSQQGDDTEAAIRYREAVRVAEKLNDDWQQDFSSGCSVESKEIYQPDTILRLVEKGENRSAGETGDLMRLLGLAGARKDPRLLPLLERKELLEDERLALSLAGYDYSLNGNPKALDFILAKLAKQQVGADVDEVVVLSFIDEWDATMKAVNSHFISTDGSGGLCRNFFNNQRKLLFPRHYLQYHGKAGEPENRREITDGSQPVLIKPGTRKWKLTEDLTPDRPPRVLEPSGKALPAMMNGRKHAAFTAHVAGIPLFMVVGQGTGTRITTISNYRKLQGRFEIGTMFDYNIEFGDRVTIKRRAYDLSKGRVFVIRPDGTLRQIAVHPKKVVPGEELDKFVSELPPEK